MSEQMPPNVKAVYDAYARAVPVPSGGPNPADEAFENRARAWTRGLAQQIVFSTGDHSWGCKNAGGGRPQSKDAIAHQNGAVLYGYDTMFGVGTGSPNLNPNPVGEDITGQVFMAVEPFDHIGGGGTQPPPDDTHKYMGGGNDTGICDVCGKGRHDAVHKIPAASQQHAYDGGEQDTGLCDVCQKPRADVIHDASVPPPDTELEARVAKLESQVAKQQRTIEEHESRIKFLEDNPASGGISEDRVKQLIAEALHPLEVKVASNGGFLGHTHSAAITGKPH